MYKYSTLLAAALTLTAAAPAFAGPDEIPVPYRDLNLTSIEGQEKLDRRLQTAAAEVCNLDPTAAVEKQQIARRCNKAVLSDARQKAQIVVARAKGDGSEYATR